MVQDVESEALVALHMHLRLDSSGPQKIWPKVDGTTPAPCIELLRLPVPDSLWNKGFKVGRQAAISPKPDSRKVKYRCPVTSTVQQSANFLQFPMLMRLTIFINFRIKTGWHSLVSYQPMKFAIMAHRCIVEH